MPARLYLTQVQLRLDVSEYSKRPGPAAKTLSLSVAVSLPEAHQGQGCSGACVMEQLQMTEGTPGSGASQDGVRREARGLLLCQLPSGQRDSAVKAAGRCRSW